MEAIDKLIKSRIEIQFRNPFFSYLSLFLKFKEDIEGKLPEWANAGINIRGDFTYRKEYVNKLTIEECESLVIHELLHLALLHLIRKRSRDKNKWNIATDVCVNQVIKDNGFVVPKDWIVSDNKNELIIFKETPFEQVIKDCNKKPAEEIYNDIKIPEFPDVKIGIAVSGEGQKGKGQGQGKEEDEDKEEDKEKEEQDNDEEGQEEEKEQKNNKGKGRGKGQGKKKQEGEQNQEPEYQGFDYHYEANEEGEISDEQKREIENEWKNRIEEALAISKLRGVVPAGIERLIGELHKERINWKALLYRYITKQIPYDYSWAKPSKKSISVGVYLPHTIKEKIDIAVGIDLSGSIGQKETNDFISEVVGIAKAFQDRLSIRIITHDVDVCTDDKVENGNIEKIKKIKIKGGGGTSHKEIFEHIKEKEKLCGCAIFFTDGYSNLDEIDFKKYSFNKLFVLSKDGDDRQIKGKRCEIIKLSE